MRNKETEERTENGMKRTRQGSYHSSFPLIRHLAGGMNTQKIKTVGMRNEKPRNGQKIE